MQRNTGRIVSFTAALIAAPPGLFSVLLWFYGVWELEPLLFGYMLGSPLVVTLLFTAPIIAVSSDVAGGLATDNGWLLSRVVVTVTLSIAMIATNLLLVARQTRRPIRRLTDGIYGKYQQLQSGVGTDLGERVHIETHDEIRLVAEAFNSASD